MLACQPVSGAGYVSSNYWQGFFSTKTGVQNAVVRMHTCMRTAKLTTGSWRLLTVIQIRNYCRNSGAYQKDGQQFRLCS